MQKFNSMNERLCSAAGFTPHVVYETLNWDTVNILAANGIGVGFVPDIPGARRCITDALALSSDGDGHIAGLRGGV
ncbi:MAG: hypothetical protein ACLVB5_02275 [Christensenellales bacterium]